MENIRSKVNELKEKIKDYKDFKGATNLKKKMFSVLVNSFISTYKKPAVASRK